jgi:hypothetical protein
MISTLSTKHTVLAVLFLGLFAMAARRVIDVGWRFKFGESIAKHKVPITTRSPTPAPPGPGGLQVRPSYSQYAINYSIEHFAGYYGLYFGSSSVGQCKHR